MAREYHCHWRKTSKGDLVEITTSPQFGDGMLIAEVPGAPDAMERAQAIAQHERMAAALAELCEAASAAVASGFLPQQRERLSVANGKARCVLSAVPFYFDGEPGAVRVEGLGKRPKGK